MLYRCWTVNCKTDGCGVCLTLGVIGPGENYKHALLPPIPPFNLTCCDCKKPHSYSVSDIEERNVENPSLTTPCVPFLDAIEKANWPKGDTDGFSDSDASVVSGVFWHEGGFIRYREGRNPSIVPDEPGWYCWFDGPDRYRYLHGPFSTRLEADFDLEVNCDF